MKICQVSCFFVPQLPSGNQGNVYRGACGGTGGLGSRHGDYRKASLA